jgi:chromate transporter
VAQAILNLGRSALKSSKLAAMAAGIAVLNFAGMNELPLLFGAGVLAGISQAFRRRGTVLALGAPVSGGWLLGAVSSAGGAAAAHGLWPLFLFFAKVGSVLYGSGYVLLSFLRSGLVEQYGWITERQLLDAVAVGQFTPGPVFTTATFAGYLIGGVPAALVATLGIFLPAFVFVAVSGPLIPRIRRSPAAGAVLDAVNAASLALRAVVACQLARAAIVDWQAAGLLLGAAIALVRYKVNSAWLILGGAAIGLARSF